MTHDQVFIAFIDFIYQRPNLRYDHGYDPSSYRQAKHMVDNQLRMAKQELDEFSLKPYDHNLMLDCMKNTWQGRLELVNGQLEYTAGQYKPTEYRECAYQVLKLYNERAA